MDDIGELLVGGVDRVLIGKVGRTYAAEDARPNKTILDVGVDTP